MYLASPAFHGLGHQIHHQSSSLVEVGFIFVRFLFLYMFFYKVQDTDYASLSVLGLVSSLYRKVGEADEA